MQTQLKKKILFWFIGTLIPVTLFVALKFIRWHNDPNISPVEYEARQILGLQIYGAEDCGMAQFGSYSKYPSRSPIFGEENRKILLKVAVLHQRGRPFFYTIKEWDSPGSPNKYQAIFGTSKGDVYEFEGDSYAFYTELPLGVSSKLLPKSLAHFSHRKWQKPTVQKKGTEILFFDAGQKTPKAP